MQNEDNENTILNDNIINSAESDANQEENTVVKSEKSKKTEKTKKRGEIVPADSANNSFAGKTYFPRNFYSIDD